MDKLKNNIRNRFIAGNIVIALIFILLASSNAFSASSDTEEILRDYLTEHYPWKEISVSDVRVTGGTEKERPDDIFVEKGPLGRAAFSFVYNDESRRIVRANVRAFGHVVKSRRSFRRNHVIEPDDIYVARMDIRRMPGSAIKEPSEIVGKTFRRSVAANIPIVEGMIAMSEAVKRGKRVILVLSFNGMTIRAAGKTKEKGYVGGHIRAVNLTSRKVVSGVLIDENTVRVEM